jgi:hypothetical protein
LSDVRIGVLANADSAKAAVNVMTNAVNDLAKSVARANNTKFKAPVTCPGIFGPVET